VLLLHWDLLTIMILFWLETVVIGIFGFLKMIVVAKWRSLQSLPFFIFHYGMFMVAHLLFIFVVFGQFSEPITPNDHPELWAKLRDIIGSVWIAIVSLVISHGFSFITNFLGQREYRQVTSRMKVSLPYGRVVILHLTLIASGFLIQAFGAPVIGLLVLIVLKTAVDVIVHMKQHSRFDIRFNESRQPGIQK